MAACADGAWPRLLPQRPPPRRALGRPLRGAARRRGRGPLLPLLILALAGLRPPLPWSPAPALLSRCSSPLAALCLPLSAQRCAHPLLAGPASSPLPALQWQVLRARGWQSLPTPLSSAALHLDWRESALRVVLRRPAAALPGADYQMRVSGLDHDWVSLGRREWRILVPVPPGHHRLQLRAVAWSGEDPPPMASWDLYRRRPPWLRWWAWLAYLLVLLASGYGLRRYGGRRLRPAESGIMPYGRLLAELKHELRTPLCGVLGMLELLEHGVLEPVQRRRIQTIRQAGQGLLQLVEDGLQRLGGESEPPGLRPAPFAPEALCRHVLSLMQPLASAKGLSLGLELVNALPRRLLGDARRIEQVLFNILGNAIKFTASGAVQLSSAWLEGQWWLWVRDSGPGLARVQLSGSRSGLGLAISRQLVERMGGQLSLHRMAADGLAAETQATAALVGLDGTVVRISLPLPLVAEGRAGASARRCD